MSFSILVNGVPTTHFRPSRGLKQGNPLSFFFFLFVSQALSYLLLDAQAKSLIQGIKISQCAPAVVDVLFTVDTLLFARATR